MVLLRSQIYNRDSTANKVALGRLKSAWSKADT